MGHFGDAAPSESFDRLVRAVPLRHDGARLRRDGGGRLRGRLDVHAPVHQGHSQDQTRLEDAAYYLADGD